MTDLRPLKAALAGCTGQELRAVADATTEVPQVAVGLLAWLEVACEWELGRREGVEYELRPPPAAVLPEEDVVSIEAIATLRAEFRSDVPAISALFYAFEKLLGSGRKRKH